jgi:hypothetical protein
LPAVCFYISGHGFGHASRQIEALNALGAARPDLDIIVRTSAPRWLFDRTARVPITLLPGECDVGVVQVDSLRLDQQATIERAARFYADLSPKAREEAALLRRHSAVFVVSDAPPLACAAAALAGVPSVVVSNFTWDWIYEAFDDGGRDAAAVLDAIRNAYRQAQAAWRLPMHGGFATFRTIVDLPFIARHARHSRDEVRRTLRLPTELPLVLSSFGGYGVNDLNLARLDCFDRCGVVITHGAQGAVAHAPRGLFQVSEPELYGSGLRYEDLVAACDIVATKPGYGIIAECVANGTAILYTSRGNFAEYDVLVSEMPRYLRCAFIEHERLFSGQWREAVDRVLSAPPPPERPATNGADVMARLIGEQLRR